MQLFVVKNDLGLESLGLCPFWCPLSLQWCKSGLHGVSRILHLSHLFLRLLVVPSFVGFVFELNIPGGWAFFPLSWNPSISQAFLNRVISSSISKFFTQASPLFAPDGFSLKWDWTISCHICSKGASLLARRESKADLISLSVPFFCISSVIPPHWASDA